MNKRLSNLLIIIVLMLPVMAQNEDIRSRIKEIELEYAPDKRVVVFDVKLSDDDSQMILEGETSCQKAYELLKDLTMNRIKNNVKLLPAELLGDLRCGVVYNSMGTIHRAASYSSETVTQTLMGTPVRVLDKKGGWLRIQTPDNYIGWINGSVKVMNEAEQKEYLSKPMMIITSLFASSYESLNFNSMEVSDLVIGNILAVIGQEDDYVHVLYADGRKAFVAKSDMEMLDTWSPDKSKESIVATAKRFAGIPYVWGGTSSKGLDCSGFTKTVYFLHNIVLPRDASQQVSTGELVDEVGDFDKLELGDLVFFGEKATDEHPKERVVHVGIYIGDYRFIHASDFIRINSFNPDDTLYDKFNTNRYLRTKRVLEDTKLRSVKSLYNHK